MTIMDKPIIQSNPLVEARKAMSLQEMRLFLLGLQDVNPRLLDDMDKYDIEFRETLVTPAQLMDIFGNTANVSKLKKSIKKAFDGKIEMSLKNGGFELNHIYQVLRYEPGIGLKIKFDDMMKPYILDLLDKQYTRYKLKEIFPLSSEYGWRIMELLQSKNGHFKEGNKQVYIEMTVEELRFALNIKPGAYDGRIGNLKKFVLDAPIEEINKKTKYNVGYEQKKEGRSIVGFKLWMEYKTQAEKDDASEKNGQEEIKKAIEKSEAVRLLVGAGINAATAKTLANKYGDHRCISNLKYAKDTATTKTRSITGYIVSCIQKDCAKGQDLFEAAEAEKKAKAEAKAKARSKKVEDDIKEDLMSEPFEIDNPELKAILERHQKAK